MSVPRREGVSAPPAPPTSSLSDSNQRASSCRNQHLRSTQRMAVSKVGHFPIIIPLCHKTPTGARSSSWGLPRGEAAVGAVNSQLCEAAPSGLEPSWECSGLCHSAQRAGKGQGEGAAAPLLH